MLLRFAFLETDLARSTATAQFWGELSSFTGLQGDDNNIVWRWTQYWEMIELRAQMAFSDRTTAFIHHISKAKNRKTGKLVPVYSFPANRSFPPDLIAIQLKD